MESSKLKSSRMKEAKYYKEEKILEIIFNDGKEYEYSKVPYDVYNGLVKAASAGKFFNMYIRGKYSFEK